MEDVVSGKLSEVLLGQGCPGVDVPEQPDQRGEVGFTVLQQHRDAGSERVCRNGEAICARARYKRLPQHPQGVQERFRVGLRLRLCLRSVICPRYRIAASEALQGVEEGAVLGLERSEVRLLRCGVKEAVGEEGGVGGVEPLVSFLRRVQVIASQPFIVCMYGRVGDPRSVAFGN